MQPSSAPTVFISYSHQDEAWMMKLLPQLHALEQAGIQLQVWHDRKIDGGDKWYPEILEAMANSAAAVLLISPDFLASKFCIHDDAWDSAERGPMPLFHADIHLHRARLFHAVTSYPCATSPDGRARGLRDDLAEARRLIEKHGYWRRKEELEDAEAAARHWPRA